MQASFSRQPESVRYLWPINPLFGIRLETFDTFTPDNDPHGERDFGAFEHNGERIFWKIDYYDRTMTKSSEDASDPGQTVRVLTIMLASEY